MYRYCRTITVRNGASLVPALQVAAELTAYINRVHGLKMTLGAELFGDLAIHWYNDMASLDAMPQFAMKAAQDRGYLDLLERMKPFVVEGSVRDQVVQLMG